MTNLTTSKVKTIINITESKERERKKNLRQPTVQLEYDTFRKTNNV